VLRVLSSTQAQPDASFADTWLENNVDPLLRSALFQKYGLLIIVCDENSSMDSSGCSPRTQPERHAGAPLKTRHTG